MKEEEEEEKEKEKEKEVVIFETGKHYNSKAVILKTVFDAVFYKLGGVEGFTEWALKSDENRREFYRLYSKFIPLAVHGSGQNIQIVVDAKAKDL